MSTLYFVVTAAAVILAWVGTAYIIRHWGVGFGNRTVRCPQEGKEALISTFSYMKGGWSTKVGRDVLQCSLLPPGPVTCDKGCLTQLQ
jgi:hypothetical protein